MTTEERRRAAEALKDLIVEPRRSRWPMILAILCLLAIGGICAYWYFTPPNERPSVEVIGAKLKSLADTALNSPVMSAPKTQPANQSPVPQSSTAPVHSEDTGLLSN